MFVSDRTNRTKTRGDCGSVMVGGIDDDDVGDAGDDGNLGNRDRYYYLEKKSQSLVNTTQSHSSGRSHSLIGSRLLEQRRRRRQTGKRERCAVWKEEKEMNMRVMKAKEKEKQVGWQRQGAGQVDMELALALCPHEAKRRTGGSVIWHLGFHWVCRRDAKPLKPLRPTFTVYGLAWCYGPP